MSRDPAADPHKPLRNCCGWGKTSAWWLSLQLGGTENRLCSAVVFVLCFICVCMCMGALAACMSVYYVQTVPLEPRRGHWILRTGVINRWELPCRWVIEIEPRSFRKEASPFFFYLIFELIIIFLLFLPSNPHMPFPVLLICDFFVSLIVIAYTLNIYIHKYT